MGDNWPESFASLVLVLARKMAKSSGWQFCQAPVTSKFRLILVPCHLFVILLVILYTKISASFSSHVSLNCFEYDRSTVTRLPAARWSSILLL